MYNPVRMTPMKYWVGFKKKGVCPSASEGECSDHGTCHQDSTVGSVVQVEPGSTPLSSSA